MNVFDTIEFEVLIRYGIAVVVFFSVILALLYMVWWGFLIILSAGSEEKVKSAINHIRHAVLGIIILVLVLFIAPIITKLLWFAYGDYISPSKILETISEVSDRVFWTEWGSNNPTAPSSDKIPSTFSDL